MVAMRFGIVGCGHIASRHAEAIVGSSLIDLSAVCDVIPEKAAHFGEDYAIPAYTNLEEFLNSKEIDAVCICTPSGYHLELGMMAADAGKHLVLEKPMTLSTRDAKKLTEHCRKQGVIMSVMHQNRFLPAVARLKKSVSTGRLGKITHGSAVVRWNRNEQYYASCPWRGTIHMDGGCLFNQAIHNIDLLLWILGEVETVFGFSDTKLRNIEAEDIAMAVLKFTNGTIATIEATTTIYQTNLEETLAVFGSSGAVVLGGVSMGPVRTWREEGQNEAAVMESHKDDSKLPRHHCHQMVLEDLALAVMDGREPVIDGDEGQKALTVIEAIYRSNKTGLPVSLTEERN